MAGHHSKQDKRVERTSVDSSPHERYQQHHPFTGEVIKPGIPILSNKKGGLVLNKRVKTSIVNCPECDIPARYTSDGNPVCPECGIICGGKDMKMDIVMDAKAAGRVNYDD
jgi:hypothetical protein